LLADDQALFRELLRDRLQALPGIEVVGETADGRDLLRQAMRLRPDVVILDITLASLNGVDATARLVRRVPGIRVLCLSARSSAAYVRAVLKAGAVAHLDKSTCFEELARAVRSVAAGHVHLGPAAAVVALDDVRGLQGGELPAGLLALGRREREVLQLVAEGCSSAQIAQRLSISAGTVEVHRRNLMRKLGLHSALALTRLAIREGLVQP
jgi:two-component system NarL family response regulator